MSKPYEPIKLTSEDVGKRILIESDTADWKRISLELDVDDCDKAYAAKFGRAIIGMPALIRAALDMLKAEDSLFAVSPEMKKAMAATKRALRKQGIPIEV